MDKNTEFQLEMLKNCLDRFETIGKTMPLPRQHFYKEARTIINDAVAASYKAGLADANAKKPTFPIDDFES